MITFNYCSEIKAKSSLFYPIHLNSEQLSFIADCVITQIHDATVIKAFVRKSQLKGIEFKIVCGTNNNLTEPKNINREYSILICPNWNVQIIDHWTSNMGNLIRCEIIKEGSERLNKTIYNTLLEKVDESTENHENTIFSKDEWTCMRKINDLVLI